MGVTTFLLQDTTQPEFYHLTRKKLNMSRRKISFQCDKMKYRKFD